jgi:hypothetical protein
MRGAKERKPLAKSLPFIVTTLTTTQQNPIPHQSIPGPFQEDSKEIDSSEIEWRSTNQRLISLSSSIE